MSATLFVQPLDLIKNRMQLSGVGGAKKEYKTSFHAFRGILQKEGFFALYNGLSAGLLRQATYTTTRLGVYNMLLNRFTGCVVKFKLICFVLIYLSVF
jgi:solute carrier family 25 oxoglutarate transporter 11